MNTTIARKLLTAGVLSLCAAGLGVQAQTASPGPPSRNANVDREDPNKPDTPQHEIPSQEAPGSGTNDDRGAAASSTPSANDGSTATKAESTGNDATATGVEPSQSTSNRPTDTNAATTGSTGGGSGATGGAVTHDPTQPIPRGSAEQNAEKRSEQGGAQGQGTAGQGDMGSDSSGGGHNQPKQGHGDNEQQTPPLTPH